MKNRNYNLLLMIICCIALPLLTYAQPGPPDDAPIDGGLSILLAAGAAYGVKKYRNSRKKQQEEDKI